MLRKIFPLLRRFGLKALVFLVLIGLISSFGIPHTRAVTSDWNFGVPGDYTFDSNLIEVSSNSGHLKDQQYATDANTAGLWHTDEASGLSAADSSANGNNATLCANGSTFASGKINNGLSLDGNASCAKVNDSASLSMSSALTQEAFVKFNSAFDKTSGNPFTVTDKGNYKLYFDSTDGKLKFELDPNTSKTWTKQGEGVGNSWPIQNPGIVQSFVEYNSALYVGLSGGTGDAEVWRYSGSGTSWTKVGGDGVNSSWGDQMFESVSALIVRGSDLLAGLGNTAGDSEVWSWNGTTWTKIGGDGINSGWASIYQVFGFANIGSTTYAALGTNQSGVATDAEVWSWNGTTWTKIGGDGINSGWADATYEWVYSITASATTLYAGLGNTAGDAEVWSWNGTTWTKIADDGLGFSAGYETVISLVYSGTTLYAGLGSSAGDADVYSYDGATWTKIGGDALNSSWAASTYENVRGLVMINSVLYAGLGDSSGDGEVWSWNGTSWTKIGGDALSSSWSWGKEMAWVGSFGNDLVVGTGLDVYDAEVWRYSGSTWSWIGGKDYNSWAPAVLSSITSLAINDGKLYVGSGGTNKQAVVWQYDGSNWSHVGGNVNSSWDESIELVYSLASYKGNLYAGLGNSTGDADVWKFNGTDSWTKIGGDAVNSSWAVNTYETVRSMLVYKGDLYAGLGNSNGDAEVWKYNGSTWTKIGGDGLNTSWNNLNAEIVAMTSDGRYIFAGVSSDGTNNQSEIWRWDGASWTQIGGDLVNSSWDQGNVAQVVSSVTYGGNTYVGLGTYTGTAEVWKYNGSTWTVVGGNGINSSWGVNTYEGVYSLAVYGSNLYAGLGNSAGDGEVWSYNGTTWTKVGGDGAGWNSTDYEYVYSLAVYGSNLYAGLGASASDAEVWSYNGTSWTKVGGDLVNSSWADATYEVVDSLVATGSYLYAGLGASADDAEVWSWNGTTWAKIGGDGLNSSWAAATYEEVFSLAVSGSTLYAGLGNSANDAEVWSWNGTAWTKIGGDSVNSGWTTNYETARTMLVSDSTLFVGLGNTIRDAEVWSYNGTSWTKVGGDDVNSSWGEGLEYVYSLAIYLGDLYAGLGNSTGDAEVWKFDGTTWSKIGGDGVNSSWGNLEYEVVWSLVEYDGMLYAGLGDSAGDAEVWSWNGTSWSKIGGDNAGSSWSGTGYYRVPMMAVYNGKLYAGIGSTTTTAASGELWSYGSNMILSSTSTSWSAGWYHIAATYDGSTAKLYVNGVLDSSSSATLTLSDLSTPLYIGTGLGTNTPYSTANNFVGMIDEIRVSNSARTSFVITKYPASSPTIQPATALAPAGVTQWSGFASNETLNGGTIKYRLSSDNGNTWKYWNDSSWATSSSVSQSNLVADINSHITAFSVTSNGLLWQAVLTGNGDQLVILNSVTVTYTPDTSAPDLPTSLTAKNETGGSVDLTSNTWYKYSTPAFSWNVPDDNAGEGELPSGIAGYYVYFGIADSADPLTAGSYQTETSYSASGLVSGSSYYLRLKVKDNAANVTTDIWAPFIYKYDGTVPIAPEYVNVSPVGCSISSTFTFTWDAGTDTGGSGLWGYEYKIGSTGTVLPITDLTVTTAPYQEGDNVFYLRAKDNAGNTSGWLTGVFCSIGQAYIIDGPAVTAGPSSINVAWVSTKQTTSFVQVYEGNTYISEQGHNEYTASHSVKIVGLQPERAYRYKLIWTDPSGNLGESTWYETNTSKSPSFSSVKVDLLNPREVLISWNASESSQSKLFYGEGSPTQETSIDGYSTTFSKKLADLNGGTSYILKFKAITKDGYEYQSDSYSFSTPPLPSISNLRFETITDRASSAMKITWTTNVETTSAIYFGPKGESKKELSSAEMKTEHTMEMTDLADSTIYEIYAKGTDQFGNTATSDTNSFTTPLDTRPPTISDITIETSNVGLDKQDKSQIAVSWKTDEPATSMVEYGEGLTGDNYTGKTVEDKTMTNSHLVIISELTPSKPYHLKVATADKAGNITKSGDQIAIPGEVPRSVLQIILKTLQGVFGWMNKLI